ncbi:MAG: serine/threonine protein kinase, partial [Mycobacteriaceae bacterium]|nr:serine/threonine protein kinase [Mycobacteriaceae bacterium]
MPLADGQVFAGYTVLQTLGAGGMGEVYLAQHPRLPRRDALKVLSAAVCSDTEYRQRFNLEAEIAATLWHPHIVAIHDRGDFEGQLWLAMDYVEGTDAAHLLHERYDHGMAPEEVVRIVTAVAEALDYAHSRHLLHRDVKPANVLLANHGCSDERIMLADFGIARWIDQASGLTGTNMTVGTVAYAAPEQLKGDDIDGRADQYALAATAFHLLTGSPPFQHSNPAVVISQHLTSDPPAIGARRPELSGLGPVFSKALAKSADGRYARCIDFARALEQRIGTVAHDIGAADATMPAVAAAGPRHAKPVKTRRTGRPSLVLVGVAAIAVVALIASVATLLVLHHHVHSAAAAAAPPPPPAVSSGITLPVVVVGANCAVLGSAAVS